MFCFPYNRSQGIAGSFQGRQWGCSTSAAAELRLAATTTSFLPATAQLPHRSRPAGYRRPQQPVDEGSSQIWRGARD